MLKLRESFSLKVHLHIRQDMLQRLWDKYVPTSSQEYGQIELIYLKDALGNIEKQPEQIQLLLHLILKNKMMQLNLMQYPAPVKICQRQMESSLQRMERYYAVQLKCLNLTMYRNVRQYFTLLEQAQENDRRYQGWQKNYREIEKQKEEYRLISLFSEKLRDYVAEYPVNTLRTMEQEFVSSLSETEYQTLAEELIWQEKPELIAYLKELEKDQCKEIVKELEKDTDMRQILSSIQKQSAKKKLITATYKLEQKEFSRFYWQVVDQKDINPQTVIWKKDRTEMVRLIDELGLESLQKMWVQMKTVGSVEGNRQVFTEKMLHLQNQYQENKSRNFQEQIAVILKENALENITDILDIEQLMQDVSTEEYTEKSEGEIKDSEFEFGESEQLVLWDGPYHVIRNLEREQEIRQERIEKRQAQAVETFKEAYYQILRTESIPDGQHKDTAQSTAQFALQIFRKQYQEQLTREEIQNICEWSQALLEVYFAEQEQAEVKKEIVSSFSFDQEEQQELTYVVKQINHYIEEQHGFEESLILHRQEDFPNDERIKKLLTYIRNLEEEQRDQFIYYLADMVQLSVQLSSQRKVSTVIQPDGMESTGLPIQSNKQETVKKLLRIEDKEFAEKLLQIEDRELAEKLLRIENREFVTKLLQNSDRQLPDVSYSSLWEWGETLLFHPEHQQEWEDAEEDLSFDESKQEDAQTQVIRRQIEMAKDRNRLQSLIRQINHQTDIQLVYMDAQLRLPQVQALLQYVQQLDEEQYGALVKELVQIIKIQKLTNEESETAAVHTGEGNNLTGKPLRIEDKEFIEKLLQVEDREFAKRLLQAQDKEFVETLLQYNDGQSQDVSYKNLWEWGEALLQHPFADEARQENDETQMTQQQIEIGKDRNHLQSLIGQINHRADVQLEYTDAQLRMPQIQALLHYIRQLNVRQYGAFVKELAQVTMIQKRSYDEPGATVHSGTGEVNTFSDTRTISLEQRMISYPILAQNIENYEKQRQSEFYRDIRKIEHKIFPQSVIGYSDAGDYVQRTAGYGLIPYEGREPANELMSYNTGIAEYGMTLYEETQKEYTQITTYERGLRENRYQLQELEYSVQKASVSEEEQQRKELRMQQENAQIKSMQAQLDNKLKEVEHQLKKVEESTKAKENVGTFAEQVKRQLYEELHVEKLRRGLI